MSALRINLLPAYIAETRNTKVALAAFLALFALATAGSLVYFAGRQAATVDMETQANAKEAEATAATAVVNAIKAESSTLRAQIAPIGDRVKFVKDVQFYNTWVQKIYRRAAAYTDRRVEYSSMAVTGDTLSMNGFVSRTPDGTDVDNLSRYLITFYGNPDVTAVSVSAPPAYELPAQNGDVTNPLLARNQPRRGFQFSVSAKLLQPLQRPALPATLLDAPVVTEPLPTGATPAAGTPGAAPGAPPVPGAVGVTD